MACLFAEKAIHEITQLFILFRKYCIVLTLIVPHEVNVSYKMLATCSVCISDGRPVMKIEAAIEEMDKFFN